MGKKLIVILLALASAGVIALGGLTIHKRFRTHEITIAAGNPKSSGYIMMAALKSVITQRYPRIVITVNESAGAEESLMRLEMNKAQLAVVQGDAAIPPSARTVAILFTDAVHILVRDGAVAAPASTPVAVPAEGKRAAAVREAPGRQPITTFADLKGKVIGLPKIGAQFKAFLFVAAQFGMKEADFKFAGGDDQSADAAFTRGEADAVFRMRSINDPTIGELVASGGVRFIGLDNGAAIHARNRAYAVTTIPRGAYLGVPATPSTDVPTVQFQRMLLARQDLGSDVVTAITEVLNEQRQDLANAIGKGDESVRPLIATITEPSGDLGFNPPTHPGARAYYNHLEVPFVVIYANELAIGFATLIVMALCIFYYRRVAHLRRKHRADVYNIKVVELIEQTSRADSAGDLAAVKTELLRILMRVLQDRDKGKITEELFHSFNSVWETAMDVAKAWRPAPPVKAPDRVDPRRFKLSLERFLYPNS